MTTITITFASPRKRPKPGDRRVTKAHGLQIRVLVRDSHGRYVVSSGRPVFEWRRPADLAPRDRWMLTPDERAEHCPPEQEPGYMQQRGAA
jgi:hypothetical protein